jgi:hypothetical protein
MIFPSSCLPGRLVTKAGFNVEGGLKAVMVGKFGSVVEDDGLAL